MEPIRLTAETICYFKVYGTRDINGAGAFFHPYDELLALPCDDFDALVKKCETLESQSAELQGELSKEILRVKQLTLGADKAEKEAKSWEAAAMTAASDRNDADALRAMLLLATARAEKAEELLKKSRGYVLEVAKERGEEWGYLPRDEQFIARIDAHMKRYNG